MSELTVQLGTEAAPQTTAGLRGERVGHDGEQWGSLCVYLPLLPSLEIPASTPLSRDRARAALPSLLWLTVSFASTAAQTFRGTAVFL